MDTKVIVRKGLQVGIALCVLSGVDMGLAMLTDAETGATPFTAESAEARHKPKHKKPKKPKRPKPPKGRGNRSDSTGPRPGNRFGNPQGPGDGPPGQNRFQSQRLRSNGSELQQAFGG